MRILGALSLACVLPATAPATILDPVTEQDLVKGADLIFQGQLIDIQYRMSSQGGPEDEVLPHTFVTYQIERLFKGSVSGPTGGTVTLRFYGGPNYAQRRWLSVGECPAFDVGDRDILFVRKNGRHVCPVVGWQQGRFRIIDGELYGEEGEEVWLSPSQTIAYGEHHPLPDVMEHHRGQHVLRRLREGDPPEEAIPPPPMQGTRFTPTSFAAYIDTLVATLLSPQDLAQLLPVVSQDADAPFTVQTPRSLPPPPEAVTPRRSRTGRTGLDRAEEMLVERFGPVLKVPKPPRGRSHGQPHGHP